MYSSNNTNQSLNKISANQSNQNNFSAVNGSEMNPADYTSSPSLQDQSYPSITHDSNLQQPNSSQIGFKDQQRHKAVNQMN